MISSILSGDRAFIAKAISMIENEDPEINDINEIIKKVSSDLNISIVWYQ